MMSALDDTFISTAHPRTRLKDLWRFLIQTELWTDGETGGSRLLDADSRFRYGEQKKYECPVEKLGRRVRLEISSYLSITLSNQ